MPRGRPTTYEKKFCNKIIEFFTVKHTEKHGSSVIGSKLPTFAMFSVKINVDRNTLHDWCENHDEFSRAYKKAKALQEDMLMNNLIRGYYSAAGAIFTAKNILGWRDKIDHEHSGEFQPVKVLIGIERPEQATDVAIEATPVRLLEGN